MICEQCKNEHDESYGSGRFCGARCARAYSTSKNRQQISDKVSSTLKGRPNPGARIVIRDPVKWKEQMRISAVNRWAKIPFEKWSNKRRRKFVLDQQDHKCLICGIGEEWNGFPLPLQLQLDHEDGNRKNNTRKNLRGLCPNCHSQTSTFSYRNVSDAGKTKAVLAMNSVKKVHPWENGRSGGILTHDLLVPNQTR